jgi:hypothetical protein
MKPLPTIERLAQAISYSPSTGELRWRVKIGSLSPGQLAGAKNKKGYICLMLDGKPLYAHRVAWALATGAWPTGVVDHINHDKSDNRLENIRDVSRTANRQNQRAALSNNSTGIIGAGARKYGRYVAGIKANGEYHYLGSFGNPQDAHQAYVEAKRKLHEGNTL